jgi:lactate permease
MNTAYHQRLDPLRDQFAGSSLLSTFLALLPVLVLFWLLVPRRWLAPKAAAAGAFVAIVVAIAYYGMPPGMAVMSFFLGAGFGMMPVGWTIFGAMLLYNVTVETGQFAVIRRSVGGISGDARLQAVLIGFAFGALLEGAAGGGTPVAICGAILVGLGFRPFQAAVLCLIANTSPVAYGGLGTPIFTLAVVTDLPGESLSIMAGHQLPLISCLIPMYMIVCMCGWKQMWEVWPALAVAGGSFALFQYTFATIHSTIPALVVYPMTDIGGGIFSLIITAIFLQFWKPKKEWHFESAGELAAASAAPAPPATKIADGHAAAAALLTGGAAAGDKAETVPLTWKSIAIAWTPYALMSVLLMFTGLVRQMETIAMKGGEFVRVGSLQTNYLLVAPGLDGQSHRDPRLQVVKAEEAAAFALASNNPLSAAVALHLVKRQAPGPEKAELNFAWLTAPGSGVFFAALISMGLFRMRLPAIGRVFWRTCIQMSIPIPTIACMLGLSYVTRYAGMDATLGIAFAQTGPLYPFFAAFLGWLGVFLTGTDAGSNALFGSLQKITATEIFRTHASAFDGLLTRGQLQVLICTANSTGGVMGKMIDAQSICVATAATHQLGKEADIFKAVFWHSILLAFIVGLLTLLQAYVYPFTLLVPHP